MTQRVFIVWANPLFHGTVALLLEHPAVTIVGATSDRTVAREQITDLMPDFIIIEEPTNGDPIDKDIIQYLETSSWEPRVARLSLQDNELQLYHRQHRTIETRDDLLALIQNQAG